MGYSPRGRKQSDMTEHKRLLCKYLGSHVTGGVLFILYDPKTSSPVFALSALSAPSSLPSCITHTIFCLVRCFPQLTTVCLCLPFPSASPSPLLPLPLCLPFPSACPSPLLALPLCFPSDLPSSQDQPTPHSKHVKRFRPGSNPNAAPTHDPAVWDRDFPLSSPFLPFPEGVHIPFPPPGT